MKIGDLKIQIVNNQLSHNLYIFYGDEYTVQRVYIQKIAEVTDSEIEYIDSIEDIVSDSGSSLFSTKRCYVCLDDTKIVKSSNLERDFEKILQIVGSNCLILQFSKMDKRGKFYNFITKEKQENGWVAVEFEQLHQVVLEKHLRAQADILPQTAQKLIEVCENDYGRCLLELDKVLNYTVEQPNKAFKVLLDNRIIYQPPGDMIFEFVNAVLANKPRLAFDLLQECKDIGEPALRLLLVLFTSIKHLLQVQSCETNVADTTGLSMWEIRNVQNYQGIYRNSELVNAMRLIRDAEMGIKTGKIEESMAVEYVLVNFM